MKLSSPLRRCFDSLTPAMRAALQYMSEVEVRGVEERICPNVSPGFRVHHNTARALVRRGLARPCHCRFGSTDPEIQLTGNGSLQAWACRNVRNRNVT